MYLITSPSSWTDQIVTGGLSSFQGYRAFTTTLIRHAFSQKQMLKQMPSRTQAVKSSGALRFYVKQSTGQDETGCPMLLGLQAANYSYNI